MTKTEKADSLRMWGLIAITFIAGMIFFRARTVGFLYSTVPFIVILGLLVFVHEFGHYWSAKRAGMTVHEFAIGMGPALWTTHGKAPRGTAEGEEEPTVYSLRAIPLGGFVRIAGMEPNEEPNQPGGFNTKPWGWRFLTLIAGCAMNFALAALLFCLLGATIGVETGAVTTRIGSVVAEYPAQKAGLQAGDRLLAIDSVRTDDVQRLRSIIEAHPGQPITLTLDRDGQTLTRTLTPEAKPGEGKKQVGKVGIAFAPEMQRVNPLQALGLGVTRTYEMTRGMLEGLGIMFSGRVKFSESVGGPVMILQQTSEVARSGVAQLINWAAILSINLGILNLLPIPALDGGRIMFLILEALRRGRRVDPRKEAYVHLAGMALLVAFILFVTYHDIRRLVSHLF